MRVDISALWAKLQAMFDRALVLLPNLVLGALVFVLFLFAGKGVRALGVRIASRARKHRNVGLVLGGLFQWALVLFGLLVALSVIVPSFKASNLIELLGIGTVAVGFAFRDILQNFFAGLLLLLTEPFRIGDQIVVGEHEGTVQAIESRATTIQTYDGRRVVIPNTILFTQAVTVNTANEKRRSGYDVGIGVGDDIEEARSAILRTILGVEGVLADGDRSRQREGWPAGTRKPVPKATRIGEALRGLAPGAAAERGP